MTTRRPWDVAMHDMSVYYASGKWVGLPKSIARRYQDSQPGNVVAYCLDDLRETTAKLGLADIDAFTITTADVFAAEDLEEEISEAEDENDHALAAELKQKLDSIRPAHDCAEGLKTVRGLLSHLTEFPREFDPSHQVPVDERSPDDPDRSLVDNVVSDLKVLEAQLVEVEKAGEQFYFDPF